MLQFELDQASRKQFGVPGIFESDCCDGHVLKSKNGDIYFNNGKGEVHLLAQRAEAYEVVIASIPLPLVMKELRKKLHSLGPCSEELLKAEQTYHNENYKKHLYFVLKLKGCLIPKVFISMPDGYQEISSVFIGGDKEAIIAADKLLLADQHRYALIEKMSLLDAPEYRLLWCGGEELAMSFVNKADKKLAFAPLGSFVKLTETSVSKLLEVKEDEDKFSLYHLGQTIDFIAYSPFEDGFEIDETTGTVVTNAAIASCGIQNVTHTYAYQNEHYKKV